MQHPKTILITGATAGIGRATALRASRTGHRVIATGRDEVRLATLKGAAPSLVTIVLDVASQESIVRAMRQIETVTAGDGIDVLVNNAGFGAAGPLEEIGDDVLRAQFDTNVFGLMAVTRAVLPMMRRGGGGRVVNVSSINGLFTMPFMASYNATKYAVESLSDGLRRELWAFGIDVVLVEPGPVRTDFADRAVQTVATLARPDSPYAAVYARVGELSRQVDAQAVTAELVAQVIERAATVRRPKHRYVVPGRLRVVLALLAVLPTRLTDWLLRAAFGLTRRGLRLPAAASQA